MFAWLWCRILPPSRLCKWTSLYRTTWFQGGVSRPPRKSTLPYHYWWSSWPTILCAFRYRLYGRSVQVAFQCPFREWHLWLHRRLLSATLPRGRMGADRILAEETGSEFRQIRQSDILTSPTTGLPKTVRVGQSNTETTWLIFIANGVETNPPAYRAWQQILVPGIQRVKSTFYMKEVKKLNTHANVVGVNPQAFRVWQQILVQKVLPKNISQHFSPIMHEH